MLNCEALNESGVMETERKIWLSSPHMGGEEIEFVLKAFKDNWVAPVGPFLGQFEQELSAYSGVSHCVALSSGTAAIHLALLVLGVERGDEVICSSFTFSGSCNPVLYLGATPVFVDSEDKTWNMDPGILKEAIEDRIRKTGKKPKAIIAVHLYGMPASIEEIILVAKEYGIPVIEDAAEAIGSEFKDRKLGSFGDLGIFSFNGNKIITTSGGGSLISNNKGWIETARFLATQARDPAPHYEHSRIGYNYRLSNVCAGIGLGQLRVLDKRVQQRRAIFDSYVEALGTFDVKFVEEPSGSFSNRWLTTILVGLQHQDGATSERLRLSLAKHNIESRPVWKPMHLQPVFKGCPKYVSGVSERLFRHGLCLPSGSNLTSEDVYRVTSILKSSL